MDLFDSCLIVTGSSESESSELELSELGGSGISAGLAGDFGFSRMILVCTHYSTIHFYPCLTEERTS